VTQYEIMIEKNEPIPFPYLTFKNDTYSEFMTSIMRNLEILYYPQDTVLASELDECNQITFVMSGKYNVGFEINKKKVYRK
jgi:glutathione peroxidase-family protein